MTGINEQRLEELMGKVAGVMTGGVMCASIQLGEELGLYKAMHGAGNLKADEVAARANCHPRLIREWLDCQSAMGFIKFDEEADDYELEPEAGLAFADEDAPMFVAKAMVAIGSMFMDVEKVADAFRGDGGLAWGDHHPCLFKGTEWFFRPGYRAHLATDWIPSLEVAGDQLGAGARVADVGCGHGASVVAMAEEFPNSQFFGFDFHAPSIEVSRQRARDAGVEGRCTFEVADSKGYGGEYDLICFFDCLHDMGDPVGIAKHAKERLAESGTVLLVEPFAIDGRSANMRDNPMAALLYGASSMICTPNSLSQEVGLGLGAQAGEGRLREVFEAAGFEQFRRVGETPFNLILEAR